ncbi:asparaginase [Caulobacter sp. AP07]|uniref:asparaginase n=1 Tax=Caulobacter sp. AP07 TaxID=1144304 RepID=UPI000308E821|nr:asparaginase [Caulobacter sp. AP07]
MTAPRKIALLTTGGTIAMTNQGRGADVSISGQALGARIGGAIDVEVTEVFAKPSPNMSLADMALLAQTALAKSRDVDGVIIAHGTDTLEETACCLDLLLRTDTPIVLTGAMRTFGAEGADGAANLRAACRVAASPSARGLGVLAVLADEIHAAMLVRKAHTSSLNAFTSQPFGPLGSVVEDRVHLLLRPARRSPELRWGGAGSHVPIVHVYSGFEAGALARYASDEVDALVLSLPGGGHVPADLVEALEAVATSKPVVFAARTQGGETLNRTYGYVGGEMDLIARGLIPAGTLDALKARIAIALLVSSGADRRAVAAFFDHFRGV